MGVLDQSSSDPEAEVRLTCPSGTLVRVGKSKRALTPKKKCCLDRPRCTRCPIRMLKDGTLPAGYTVHRRRLVRA